jgi:diguanylate cyclase (GGDEF)-like protein
MVYIGSMATVLLVDDERFARQVYTDHLKAAGFETETAATAEEAVRLLTERRFDVLVADMILPGHDGLHLLNEAKRIDPDIEVVMITALDLVMPAVRAMRSGASDYLVKPVTPEALQIAVQRCLATRDLLAENKTLRGHLNLFETCQRITSVLERDKLLPLAVTSVVSECGATTGAIFERGEPPGTPGWSISVLRGLDQAQGEALLTACRERLDALTPEEPMVVSDLDRQRPRLPSPHAICIPIADGEMLLGAACVLDGGEGGAIPRERARNAQFVCRHVGVALRTLGRFKQVEHLAYVDDLTHLYNTRYLHMVLDREIAAERPFTVLFLDLDHFKGINDEHGHLTGSKLLVEVGRVLKACVRDHDVVIRYGGDEYVVVLVGIDSGGALKVAERIRRAIEQHNFLAREGPRLRMTTSIGMASYPEHAATKAAILEMADRAMYRGKRTTRNVIYMASTLPQ